jgi:hydrogenase-4 component F
VYVMAVLLIVIFIGFMNHFRIMYYQPVDADVAPAAWPSAWCAVPMWLALAPLLILGLWWPGAIWDYLMGAAQALSSGSP